jgi:hypothetical protein
MAASGWWEPRRWRLFVDVVRWKLFMPPIPIDRLRMKFFGYVPIGILNTGISHRRFKVKFKVKSHIQRVIKNMLRIFLFCLIYLNLA